MAAASAETAVVLDADAHNGCRGKYSGVLAKTNGRSAEEGAIEKVRENYIK